MRPITITDAVEAARRSLEHPVVELQAMAYRHTAARRLVAVPSSSATVTAPAAPRRARAVLLRVTRRSVLSRERRPG